MVNLRIPTPLRSYTEGKQLVQVAGNNVDEALNNLVIIFPALKKHLYNDNEELRPFINLYLGDEDICYLQGINTPLRNGDTLIIIPSIAGGICN